MPYMLVYNISQILLLRLYARRHRPTAAVVTTVDNCPTSNDASTAAHVADPLNGLDIATRMTFQVRL